MPVYMNMQVVFFIFIFYMSMGSWPEIKESKRVLDTFINYDFAFIIIVSFPLCSHDHVISFCHIES